METSSKWIAAMDERETLGDWDQQLGPAMVRLSGTSYSSPMNNIASFLFSRNGLLGRSCYQEECSGDVAH